MCALFGYYDVGKQLPHRKLEKLIRALSVQSECRGTDATGIGYAANGVIRIFKAPKPAHKLKLFFPAGTTCVTGHTRAATQGDPQRNYNNHPFSGKAGDTSFCLAHNGVLWNQCMTSFRPPKAKIETDSFAAVQVLEQQDGLDIAGVKRMTETVVGSFAFSILDSLNNLYLVRGSNPIVVFFLEEPGLYVYASTSAILEKALRKCRLEHCKRIGIPFTNGDVLRIGIDGTKRSSFAGTYFGCWGNTGFTADRSLALTGMDDGHDFLLELGEIAGVPENDIRQLLEDGYSESEIAEFLETPELFIERRGEVLCDGDPSWKES